MADAVFVLNAVMVFIGGACVGFACGMRVGFKRARDSQRVLEQFRALEYANQRILDPRNTHWCQRCDRMVPREHGPRMNAAGYIIDCNPDRSKERA